MSPVRAYRRRHRSPPQAVTDRPAAPRFRPPFAAVVTIPANRNPTLTVVWRGADSHRLTCERGPVRQAEPPAHGRSAPVPDALGGLVTTCGGTGTRTVLIRLIRTRWPCRLTTFQTVMRRRTVRMWHFVTRLVFVWARRCTRTSLWWRRTVTQRAGILTRSRTRLQRILSTILANPIALLWALGWSASTSPGPRSRRFPQRPWRCWRCSRSHDANPRR